MNENDSERACHKLHSPIVPPVVPMQAISKGRSLDDVLSAYMEIWDRANEVATEPGKSPDDIFADTMTAVAYRIYLLGVEDGMRVSPAYGYPGKEDKA